MFSVALFWASAREESLALKLQIRLQKEWVHIYPINPRYPEINWTACYPNFEGVYNEGQRVDLFVFMTNPELTLDILSDNLKFWVKKVWFQPGSFDDSVISKAESLGLKINTTHCMLVAPQNLVEEFVNKD